MSYTQRILMGKLRQKAVYNNQKKGGQQVCFNIPSALF